LGEQLSRRKREEGAKEESRNPTSAAPSADGTSYLEEDSRDELSNGRMGDEPSEDEAEKEFWTSTIGDNDIMDHKVKPSSMTCDLGL
jgi:hypothetical protein